MPFQTAQTNCRGQRFWPGDIVRSMAGLDDPREVFWIEWFDTHTILNIPRVVALLASRGRRIYRTIDCLKKEAGMTKELVHNYRRAMS